MKKTGLIGLILLFTLNPLNAETQYGEFLYNPSDISEVKTSADPEGAIRQLNGETIFQLTRDFGYRDPSGLLWPVPKGQKMDGASIPWYAWSIAGPPIRGPYFHSAVIHDYYCCMRVRSATDTHNRFLEAMMANGMPRWKALMLYYAVIAFGPDWDNPSTEMLNKYPLQSWGDTMPICEYQMENGRIISNNLLTFSNKGFNKKDIAEKEIALRKIVGVAQILKSTNGRYFDVGSDGLLPSSPELMASMAEEFYELVSTDKFQNQPDKLGILANESIFSLAEQTNAHSGVIRPPVPI